MTPENEQPQRSVNDDEEYRRNYSAAEYVNALFALDNDWRGQGVLVGVIDNGVRAIGDLEGQVDQTLSRDFGYIEENGTRSNRNGDNRVGDETSDHGTPVAGIIAGRDDGRGIQGLAPDATIVSLRVDANRDGVTITGVNRDEALRYAADLEIPLVNMSLARRPGIPGSQSFMDAVAYYNERAQGLLVAAAGNNGAPTSGNAVEVDPNYAESWLIVAALENTGKDFELASYSNRCGTLMNRCVVAPANNTTLDVDGGISVFRGTSGATPVVTSVAALILSRWPQLSGIDAGNIILNTAQDLGAPGVDEIYGHGLVDAEAALRPANPTLSNSKTSASAQNTFFVLGEAFGGSLNSSVRSALDQVTILDHFGRDYAGDFSGLVVSQQKEPSDWLRQSLIAQANAQAAGFATVGRSGSILVNGFDTGLRDAEGAPIIRNRLSQVEFSLDLNETMSVRAGFNSQNNVTADALGLAPTSDVILAYSPLAQTSFGVTRKLGRSMLSFGFHTGGRGDVDVTAASLQYKHRDSSLKLGVIDEEGSVFGTPVGLGILRFGDGARTYFLEAKTGFDLGGLSLEGFGSVGATRLRIPSDTLLTDAGMISSGRFGFLARHELSGGQIGLGLAQPLVAIRGNATFTVGDRYSLPSRSLLFADRRVSLAGQIAPQLTLSYEKRGPRSAFRLGMSSDVNARDARGLAIWNLRFGPSRLGIIASSN